MLVAAEHGEEETVSVLVQARASVNAADEVRVCGRRGAESVVRVRVGR